MGWFDRLTTGLNKTRKNLVGKVESIISGYSSIQPELLDEIEELLVTADIGASTALEIIDHIKEKVQETGETNPECVESLLKDELKERLSGAEGQLTCNKEGPTVMLVM